MDTLFLRIFNVSITATWLVLALFIIRLFFKNAPKWLMNGLWGMVALRLLLPFSIESVFSVVPSRETIPSDILTSTVPRIDSGISFLNRAVNPLLEARSSAPSVVPPISDTASHPTSMSLSSALSLTEIASIVWIIGVTVMLLLAVFSYVGAAERPRND
jgi:beta-lactamase regulating signal transducer with metallopeptidase domain